VNLAPKPVQRPHPPIRVAANSADTFPIVGELGDTVMVAGRVGPLADLIPNIRAYRDAYRSAGHAGRGEVYLRIPVYVAETDARARDEPEASVMAFYRNLGARIEASAEHDGVRAVERRAERGRGLQTITYDEALRDKLVVG
jgi:alkanesulfonate monooxygenase SsuD/methylene tetrahydromethanopterin reductase-like flavin-dependent oxidoreductase (luciferase family)